MRFLIFTLLLFSYANLAIADETWINFGGRSYHKNRDKQHREENYGLGIRQPVNEYVDQTIGYYRNSNDLDSFYIAYPITYPLPLPWVGVRFGIAPGLVIGGYKETIIPAAPWVAIIRLSERVALNVVYIPKVTLGRYEIKEEVYWFKFELRL